MSTNQSCCCKPSTVDTDIPELPEPDNRGDFRCRISNRFRMNYQVAPGLYRLGKPTPDSPVLVTTNYRLTCNHLFRAMEGHNSWVLVLDTRGINVWCAAGKGTFGTAELIKQINAASLSDMVNHRTLILPQLGAPGVAGHEVKKATGFSVVYGPVYARDLPAFISDNMQATTAMRTVTFTFAERIILTPMELIPALKKYLIFILGLLAFVGLEPSGILFKNACANGAMLSLIGLLPIVTGTVLFPMLLPVIPVRSFAAGGALLGIVTTIPVVILCKVFLPQDMLLVSGLTLFYIILTSYFSLNFTGCTPFTSISGVKLEMRSAVPAYLVGCIVSALLLIAAKLHHWSII